MGFINPCNPAVNAIIFYIILILVIFIIKPNFIYDHKNDKFKEFGCGDNQTYFPLMLFGIISCVFIYYIFVLWSGIKCSKLKYLIKYT